MASLVLASASPRRRTLLGWAGISVVVRPVQLDERPHPGEEGRTLARRLAEAKARAARAGPEERVLAADTVVHLPGRVLDKPASPELAHRTLRELSGRWHEVSTGVALRRGEQLRLLSVSTRVRFRELSSGEIARYVASGEPMGKAGAYAIQGQGGALVAELRGSWTNVMGLPLEQTLAALKEAHP